MTVSRNFTVFTKPSRSLSFETCAFSPEGLEHSDGRRRPEDLN
jgi:hypothetical protein